MHSPPPTPNSRSAQHAKRKIDALAQPSLHRVRPHLPARTRSRDQAGLITPRETPKKVDPQKGDRTSVDQAAKVLFPSARKRKFEVFQDPSEPDPFCDDEKNPFAAPKSSKAARSFSETASREASHTRPSTPPRRSSREKDVELDTPRARRLARRTRTPSPHRTDGMTYIFRGKRVFRKFASEEEAEAAAAVAPKRLFVKEMHGPQLSNPFLEGSSDEEDINLSTTTDRPGRPKSLSPSLDLAIPRRLF